MAQTEGAPPAIVVIGGGNGASTILRGLAEAGLAHNTTGLITVYDDGGSTGMLRELNPELPAPGDIRRGLAALALDEEAALEFNRRREEDGHVVGNLVLASLTEELGSFDLAIAEAARRLRVVGRILPVSREAATLVLEHMGEKIIGEHVIENSTIIDPWAEVSLEPPVAIHPDAAEAIASADMIVIAPGSLYASLGAALAPRGMPEALQASRAKLVAVANLHLEMNQAPDGWHVADHIVVLEGIIGRRFDTVLHHAGPLPSGAVALDTHPLGFEGLSANIIGVPGMATLRESDGTAVHDARIVARQLGQLLLPQRQYVH